MGKKSIWTAFPVVAFFSLTLANPLNGQNDPFAGGRVRKPAQPVASKTTPTFEFKVSKVGADKSELMTILEVIGKMETKEKGAAYDFRIASVIDSKNFLCYKSSYSPYPISQLSRADRGGRIGTLGLGSVNTDRTYWVTTINEHKLADDETLAGLIVVAMDTIKKRG